MTERRRVVLVALGLVVICAWLYGPGLGVGFLADDLFQISMLEGRFGRYSPAHLYAFAPEDPVSTAAHVERGSLPWWTHPQFRFVMVRPLSSLLLAFDHWAWPRASFAHHLHSALWFVAALVCGYRLIRRCSGLWVAIVSIYLFAVDETMTWMVAWLANRCALVCTVFSMLALLAYIRDAERVATGTVVSARSKLAEFALWCAAFSGGEYAVGGVAYLAAYVLLGDPRPFRARMLAMWPALVALVVFMLAYFALHGGVYGDATYIDPFRETSRFLGVAGHRLSRMLAEVWLNFAGEAERFVYRYEGSGLARWVMPAEIKDSTQLAWRHGAFALASVALVLPPAWRLASPYWREDERIAIRWIGLGSILSLVPIAAIPPATRALLLPNFGAAVVVGGLVVAAIRAWSQAGRPRVSSAPRATSVLRRSMLLLFALLLTYLHFARELLYAREQLAALQSVQAAYARFYQTPELEALDVEGKHVVVVATPGLVTGIHGISMMNVLGMQPPKTWHVLGMGRRSYTMRRLGTNELEVGSVGGAMHGSAHEILFRSSADALREGQQVEAGLFSATVLNDRGGSGPGSVLFRFRWPLEDSRIVFLEVGERGLRPFTIPEVGKVVAVAAPRLPMSAP